jgi:hypothetical protein
MAPIDPTIKDKIAQIMNKGCNSFQNAIKVLEIRLIKVNKMAILGTIAKKAVTLVGEPS